VVAPYQIGVGLPTKPRDVVVDFVDITTDTGEKIERNFGEVIADKHSWIFHSIPVDAKYLNVTVAVQKLRTVEFLVKPARRE
jgi:hypothetical protein